MVFHRFGLIEAIKNLCTDLDAANTISVRFISNLKHLELSTSHQLHLYRIAQELTNNAVKHSKATQLVVQLLKDEDG